MKQSFTTGMCSDDLAGAAKRRVPIPRGGALVKQSFTTGMRSDDLAGAAERRVPIPKKGGRGSIEGGRICHSLQAGSAGSSD